MANFSHTHDAANASFSICVYRDSVQVIEREAHAAGCHWPWTFCSRTAPKPWEEASAEMVVSAVGSYSIRMLGVVSSLLRLVKALSCVGVQSQAFFALNSSRNGLDNSAMFGENLPSWFTIPRNLWSSETDFGVSICCMTAVLLGSAVNYASLINDMSQEHKTGFAKFTFSAVAS